MKRNDKQTNIQQQGTATTTTNINVGTKYDITRHPQGEFIYINIYVIKYKKQTNLYYNLFLRTWHTNKKISQKNSHPLNTHF